MRRLFLAGALTAALAAVAPAPAMTLGARTAIWSLAAARHGGTGPADLTAALGAGGLVFEGGGDAAWLVAQDANAVGGTCARSGAIGDSQSTWIETEVEGPGMVSFRWKVSSQARLDTLSFWIDGARRASIAGEKGYAYASFDVVGDGVHTLRWTYAKSASGVAGEDCGWLDDVQWTPGLAELTLGSALDAPELDWSTGGNGAAEWVAVPSPSWDGVDACAAYADGAGGVARLSTRVNGPGTVSFRWKVTTGAALAGIAFMVDGKDVELCDSGLWTHFSAVVSGTGMHNLTWEFFWDGVPNGDAGFLDCVIWSPESVPDQTIKTPEPVPYLWLSGSAATILAAHGGDYEAAALAPAANGVNKVWECYVAGIDPTDEEARFEATIEIGADGKPEVKWNPPLSEEEVAKRTYRTYGKKTLDPKEEWIDVTDVEDLDAAGWKFFKAAVEMK